MTTKSDQDDLFNVEKRTAEMLREAFEKLPEELREAADEIQCLYADLATAEAEPRYKIGQVVLRVSEESNYGDEGVKKIAKALGWSLDLLYQCKRVVESWPNGISDLLAKTEEARRMPVTWSHLVELTRAGERRDELLKEVQEQGLTVRGLRDKIGTPKRPKKRKAKDASTDERSQARTQASSVGETGGGDGDHGVGQATQGDEPDSRPTWLVRVLERVSARIAEDEQYAPEFRKQLERGRRDTTEFDCEAAWIEVEDLIRRREEANKAETEFLGELRDFLRPAQAAA